MSKLDIFPPARPTPSSKGNRDFKNDVPDDEYEKRFTDIKECIQCGMYNKITRRTCGFCDAPNWDGKYS